MVNTDKQIRPWSSRPQQLVGHFHFLNISEERHSDVGAKGSNFLPMVERSKVGFPEDEKSFSHTEFASFGDWIERLAPI